MTSMRVLILGATGMLGHMALKVLSEQKQLEVYGTIRSKNSINLFTPDFRQRIICDIDVINEENLIRAFEQIEPNVVINCISPPRSALSSNRFMDLIPICAVLPHRLSMICSIYHSRLVHISTDGVFAGTKGDYAEVDIPDSVDCYGISKIAGEVDSGNCLTIRTSIIGPELTGSGSGFLAWFLGQKDFCNSYTRVIYSGLPTLELSRIIRDFIIPNPELTGIYNIASNPISKHDLLTLIAKEYKRKIQLMPVDFPIFNRSLNSTKFYNATGYKVPAWPELVSAMASYNDDRISNV